MTKLRYLVIILIFTIFFWKIGNVIAIVEDSGPIIEDGKYIPQRVFIDNLSDYNDFVILGYCREFAYYKGGSRYETWLSILTDNETTNVYDLNGQQIPVGYTIGSGCTDYGDMWRYFVIRKSSLESIGGVSKLDIFESVNKQYIYIKNPELKDNYQIIFPNLIFNAPIIGAIRYIHYGSDTISADINAAIIIYSLKGRFNDSEFPIGISTSKEIFIYDNNSLNKYKIYSIKTEDCNATDYCSLHILPYSSLDSQNNMNIEYTNKLDLNYSFISYPIGPKPIERNPITSNNSTESRSIFLEISCFFKRLFGLGC